MLFPAFCFACSILFNSVPHSQSLNGITLGSGSLNGTVPVNQTTEPQGTLTDATTDTTAEPTSGKAASIHTTGPVLASDDHAIAIFSEDLDIALETSGILKQLNVNEGDLIGHQQVLGSLNSERSKLEFELAALQLELAEEKTRRAADEAFAKATIEIAEKNIERANSASGAIAPSELDQYQFEKTRGDLALQQATEDRILSVLEAKTAAAQKNVAEHDLDLHSVKSPIEGVVVELYQRPGEFLQAGQPLLRIVKNDVMRISAAIDLRQAEQIEKGCPVTFRPSHWTDANKTQGFTGKIIFVSPETFGEIRTVKVLAEVQVPNRNLKAKVDGRLEIFAKP